MIETLNEIGSYLQPHTIVDSARSDLVAVGGSDELRLKDCDSGMKTAPSWDS